MQVNRQRRTESTLKRELEKKRYVQPNLRTNHRLKCNTTKVKNSDFPGEQKTVLFYKPKLDSLYWTLLVLIDLNNAASDSLENDINTSKPAKKNRSVISLPTYYFLIKYV